jgi:hypothetical protein
MGPPDCRSRRGGYLPAMNFLRVVEDISSRNVMVDANFSAAETAEVLFRPICARAIKRVCFLMVDTFDFETLMKVVP